MLTTILLIQVTHHGHLFFVFHLSIDTVLDFTSGYYAVRGTDV